MILKIRKKGVITYPKGFKASALHSGIKKRKPDLALILSESLAVSAGAFTVNKFKAAPVLLDKIGHYRSVGGQGADGCLLILAHEAAVPFHIGAEDGGELALDGLLFHGRSLVKDHV